MTSRRPKPRPKFSRRVTVDTQTVEELLSIIDGYVRRIRERNGHSLLIVSDLLVIEDALERIRHLLASAKQNDPVKKR